MATNPWSQQYQQYQQQPQHYQQSQQYTQAQQYQHPQQYQQNEQYQAQQHQYQQQPQGYSVQLYQHNQQYQAHHYQQPQHGQSTQQYQQVRQGPPVAQNYPQTQSNQPAQQYPQQQLQQPQQAYNGYQHQNAPTQYPMQQYAPQQQSFVSQHGSPPAQISPQQPGGPQRHGTSQYGAYQQTRQPQRNPIQGQSPPQTAPQPCFNCGNTGHFAMDCPEPIRAVPAGKANPQAFQNPLRRPKTGGPVASTPQYPSHPNQVQEPPKGYPSPHYGQTGHPQYPPSQQAHSPSTSPSTHSSAQAQYYQQWQRYYQSQQAYQQGNHQQGSQYHQQSYAAPHGQAVGHQNGPRTPSQTSIQASPRASGIQTYQTQCTPTLTARVQPSHNSDVSSSNAQPTSPLPVTHETEILDYDFEEDDLNSLDIPDLPQSPLPFPNVPRHPINLIGQPLPSNSIVADALAPFPSPAPQDEGRCRSKYQYDPNFNVYNEHFKNSKYWDKEHADDVVFSDLSADGEFVTVDEVLSKIKQRHTHPGCGDEFNRRSRSQSRAVSIKQDSLDVNTTLTRVERELAEAKAKLQAKLEKGRTADAVEASPSQSIKVERPQLRDEDVKQEYQTPPQSATSEKPVKSEPDAEDVLAALGVTGAPKPVTASHWPDQYTGYGSPHDLRVSRSGSSSRADIPRDQRRPRSSSGQVAIDCHPNGSISSKQRSVPPPPPPPIPFGQQSYRDGTYGSPLSAGTASANTSGHSANGVDQSNANMNGFISPSTDGQAPSPMEARSEKSHNRKRHRESSSDEEDTPKRRQEDDYTPKFKKRQPKVAEAYGRRW